MERPMNWFNVYRTVALIASILLFLWSILNLVFIVLYANKYTDYPVTAKIFEIVLWSALSILFFLISLFLRQRKKTVLFLIYSSCIILPVGLVAQIPLHQMFLNEHYRWQFNHYPVNLFNMPFTGQSLESEFMEAWRQVYSNYSLDELGRISVESAMNDYVSPVLVVAVIGFVCLFLNSIYFYKRRQEFQKQ